MFEIQEDHVRKTLIVALMVIARITDVFHNAKTLKIVFTTLETFTIFAFTFFATLNIIIT